MLKSGCKIDELGHHSAERLERAIAIRMVIAWRVMLITVMSGRTGFLTRIAQRPILS